MLSRSSSATTIARAPRLSAVAAVIAAALASPGLAGAQPASPAVTTAPSAATTHHRWEGRRHHWAVTRETVEARISTLHSRLGITPDEEPKWAAVAQVMRDNEADMHRLIADRREAAPHAVTAVEDLKTYEHFTQAHVNGLKNLISSFEVLYAAMPAPQQAVADHVFTNFANRAATLKG